MHPGPGGWRGAGASLRYRINLFRALRRGRDTLQMVSFNHGVSSLTRKDPALKYNLCVLLALRGRGTSSRSSSHWVPRAPPEVEREISERTVQTHSLTLGFSKACSSAHLGDAVEARAKSILQEDCMANLSVRASYRDGGKIAKWRS